MQPSQKQPGSFINREQLSEQMAEAKAAPKPAPAPIAAAAAAPVAAEPTKEDEDQKALAKLIKGYEDATGVVITEENIQDYIFKGELKLGPVTIVPGHLVGTYRTLTSTQELEIDRRMAKLRDGAKLTQEGIDSEKAILILSQCWLTAYKLGGNVRSLGETAEDREKTIRTMGSHVVQLAGEAWNMISFLVRYTLRKESILKK